MPGCVHRLSVNADQHGSRFTIDCSACGESFGWGYEDGCGRRIIMAGSDDALQTMRAHGGID